MIEVLPFSPSFRQRIVPLFLVFVGASVAGYGIRVAPARTWPNLLLDGYYVLSLGVIAIFFIATQRLSGAEWSAGLRRIPEALMSVLPVAALLMLLVFVGRHSIYPWSDPSIFAHEPAIAGKVYYLRVPFVFTRMVLMLALWIFFAWLFRRTSLQQDRDANLLHHRRLNRYAAIFIIVFAVSFTLGAYDWLISLDPSWFSTMYAVYVFAGCFVQGIAAITLAAVILRERGLLKGFVTDDQLHDLGKLLFAFSTFWAYIWVAQYLLIWYGNIPDEITHYVKRTQGPWLFLFLLNLIVNWVVPFVVLLSRDAKRRPGVLKTMSIWLLCGHWLDLYLLIMPALWGAPKIGFLEVIIATGYAGLFYFIFVRSLSTASLVPLNDPYLIDSLRQSHS